MTPESAPESAPEPAREPVSGQAPDDRTSGLTGGPDSASAAERALPSRAAAARRLQELAGLPVRGSDGKTVGRVRDLYQQDAGGELAAISVMPRQLSARTVLIPAAAIASLPAQSAAEGEHDRSEADAGSDGAGRESSTAAAEIELLVETATAKDGPEPPETLHVTPQDLRDAAAALGLGDPSAEPAEPADPAERTAPTASVAAERTTPADHLDGA
ncbi:PRC-barrel domain-containing protein [Brachybacterium sp. AOP43-C2-M15]|uniref:PRC-barrel domain-containing protein n=1 Tax=Brachybacterium sp. AOP43-C2-M15 TaxID=3457661 RepID=UPI0040346AB3